MKIEDDIVKETTTTNFRQDVLMESLNQPVLVDFWAPWCEPCKQIAPILEKIVRETKDKVKLVKMNIEEYPQIAGQLGIKSVPAVFAFIEGQPVDGFVGNLVESQIKDFVMRLIDSDAANDDFAELLTKALELMTSGDTVGAAEIFIAILAEDPENIEALAGLSRAQINLGALDQAKGIIENIPEDKQNNPAMEGAKAALKLAEQAALYGDVETLQKQLENDPKNFDLLFSLSLALNAKNRRLEAIEPLINIIKIDRTWNEEAARKQLLHFFEAWGFADKATLVGRRKLSTALFS